MEVFNVPEHTIVKYIRDKKKRPIGMILAVKSELGFKVGYSFCRRSIDRFCRDTGLKIALGRAESGTIRIVNGAVLPINVPRDVAKEIPAFVERCRRYYGKS